MRSIAALPQIRIRAKGRTLPDHKIGTLSGIRVESRTSLPTLCELTFLDPPEGVDLEDALAPGTAMSVQVMGQEREIFSGQVTATQLLHESDRSLTLRVRGYDLTHQLRKRNEARRFENMTAADLARLLASAIGMTVRVENGDSSVTTVTEYHASDLELLQQELSRVGLFYTVQGDSLTVYSSAGFGHPVDLKLGESLWRFEGETNADRAASRVSVHGWNPGTTDTHQSQSRPARTGRDSAAGTSASAVGGQDERPRYDVVTSGDELARDMAQGTLDTRDASTVVVTGLAEGNAEIHPGVRIKVSGVGRRYAGQHVVTKVTHTIEESGFLTEFSTAPPPPPPASVGPRVTFGIVADVDDPQGLGRVRANLPSMGDVLTDWLPVTLPGAAANKGLLVLPDQGDHVIILFPSGDYVSGVAIGAVFGSQRPEDAGVVGSSVRRYLWISPGGHRVVLDDDNRSIELRDSTGNLLLMSPDRVQIHAETDMLIDAPGRSLTIRADSVDFKRSR